MTDSDRIPAPVRHRLEASIEAFRAALTDADVSSVGRDPDYVPDSPRLQAQIERRTDNRALVETASLSLALCDAPDDASGVPNEH